MTLAIKRRKDMKKIMILSMAAMSTATAFAQSVTYKHDS